MEEPRRYRTRSHAKVDGDSTLGSSTSSARSSTRSMASSTSSTSSKTKSTSGKRGRPRKNAVDYEQSQTAAPKNETAPSRSRSSAKRTVTSTATTTTATSKKVTFTESEVKDKENYCPSEDELVCVTSKRTRAAASSSSSSASGSAGLRKQATTRRKQPLAETADPETANKAPAKKATTTRGIPKRKASATKSSTLDSSRARRAPVTRTMEAPARRPQDSFDESSELPEAPPNFLQTPAKRPPVGGSMIEGSTIKVSASMLQTPAKRPLFTIPQAEEKEEEKIPSFKASLLQTPAKRPPPSAAKVEEKVRATPYKYTSLQTPAKRPPPASHNDEEDERQRSRENSPPKRVKSGEHSPESIPTVTVEAAPAVMASAAKRPPPSSSIIQTKSTPFKQAPASEKKVSFTSSLSTPARRPPTGSMLSNSKPQNESMKSNPFAPSTVQQPPRRIVGLDVAAFPKTCVKMGNSKDEQSNKMSFLHTPMRKPNMGLQRIPEKEEENKHEVPKSVMKTPRRAEEQKRVVITPSPEKREMRIYTPVPVSPQHDDVAEHFSDLSFSNIMPVKAPKLGIATSAPNTPKGQDRSTVVPKTAPPKAVAMARTGSVKVPPVLIEEPKVEAPVTIYEDVDAEHEIIDESDITTSKPPSFELFSDEIDGDGDVAMEDEDDFQAVELQSPTPTSRRQSGIFAPVSPKLSPPKSPLKETSSHGPITPPGAPKASDLMFFSSPAKIGGEDESSDDEEMDENRVPTLQFFDQQFAIDPRLMQQSAANNTAPASTMKIALKPPADESPIRRGSHDLFGPITPRAPAPPVRNTPAATPNKTPRTSRKSISGPLSGATVYVDARTIDGYDASTSFAQSLTNLGARCVKQWTWNPLKRDHGFGAPDLDEVGITHVVFKDGSPRTLQKVKETQGLVFCVGVTWAMECERQQRWVEEDEFLYDLDFVPRGGQRRRKSMEPKALANSNNVIKTPGKENPQTPGKKDSSSEDFSFFSKPLAPMPPSTPLPTKIGMALNMSQGPKTCPPKDMNYYFELENNPYLAKNLLTARRKSLQFKPKVSSPLRQNFCLS